MRRRQPDTRGERALKAVLAALVEGRMADGQAQRSAVDRVIEGIGQAMLAGMLVLLVFALGQKAVLATLTLGLFAAGASAAAGAALGFLFALPSSAARVVVAPGPAPAPGAPPGEGGEAAAATAQAAADIEDWFRDNTALERLSDWLVGAIIALSLANFEAWRLRLQTLAMDVTRGMGLAGGEWGAPAGVIMAAYALLGFLGAYLWTRRHMLRELVRARREARDAQQGALTAAEAVTRMDSPANVQNVRAHALPAAQSGSAAQQAVEAARATLGAAPAPSEATESAAAAALPDPWVQILEAGPDPADPWAGVFGGRAAGGGVELAATVRPVEGNPELFGVDITISGRPGQRVRLYLHPTFPNAIRELALDATGQATQRLLAWGAFTVGAQFDTGELRELNLAALPGAPERFRSR